MCLQNHSTSSAIICYSNNTLLMAWLCCHTLHFCILVKPTHCSHVYLFSHTEESWVWHRIQHQPWFQRTHGLCSGKWCWRVCVDFFQGHKVCWAPSSSAVIASSHILVQKCHLHWWRKSLISSNSWMGIFLKWWASWVYFALVHLCTRCPVALTGTAGHRHLRI